MDEGIKDKQRDPRDGYDQAQAHGERTGPAARGHSTGALKFVGAGRQPRVGTVDSRAGPTYNEKQRQQAHYADDSVEPWPTTS